MMKDSNMWTIVSGDEVKPEPRQTTTAAIQDWQRRENKVKVLLRMSIKDNIIPHIRECKTSKETSDTVKNLYETNNTNRILYLMSKILSIKMEENESISNFISRIKDLKDKLGDIGETISSTDLVTVTLNGMLDEYQMFITSIAAREKAPTFDELAGILMQEEERRRSLNKKYPNSDLTLMAKGNQAFKGKQRDKNKGKRSQVK